MPLMVAGAKERRVDKQVHGRGKTRSVGERETRVVGIENLSFFDRFNDPKKAAKPKRRGTSPNRSEPDKKDLEKEGLTDCIW